MQCDMCLCDKCVIERQLQDERIAALEATERELREALKVLAVAFEEVQRHCGYANFAGTKGVDLIDAKKFLDRMTSGNYVHHSRAAVGYIGRVLGWINTTSKAMNKTRKLIFANPIASAAVREAGR